MEYLDVDTIIHHLNPLTKLIGLLSFFILGGLISDRMGLLVLIGMIFILYALAKATRVFGMYCRVFLWAGVFMLVLQVLFSHDGAEWLRFVPRNIPVLGWMGVINRDSFLFGLLMIERMMVFGLSLPLLLATTQSRDLVLTLVDRLKCPYQYAFMFITSLRFIPTLFVEIESIRQAQKARAFEMNSKNPVKQVKAYLPLVTPLVLIALKKAEQLAIAMETRGYGIGPRTSLRQHPFRKSDAAVSGIGGCLVIAAIVLRITGYIS